MVAPMIKDLIHIKYVLTWILILGSFVLYCTYIGRNVCFSSIILSLLLALTYVGSLHIWKNPEHRDHPTTIKRRCISVLIVMLLSPVLVYYTKPEKVQVDIWSLVGLRISGIFYAATIPLLLTMILFLGPLVLHYLDGMCSFYSDMNYWAKNFKNWMWIRNHVVAPLSEELTFRACMLPGLVACLGEIPAILVCPLFFGVAHLHHFNDLRKTGHQPLSALMIVGFQFVYTTIFGTYSAFLFVRTGHLLAPVIVHSFCNHMGVPEINELPTYDQPMRTILWAAFIFGVLGWGLLLMPLTEPSLFDNKIYWQDSTL